MSLQPGDKITVLQTVYEPPDYDCRYVTRRAEVTAEKADPEPGREVRIVTFYDRGASTIQCKINLAMEGVTWVRGWEDEAADALRVAVALF